MIDLTPIQAPLRSRFICPEIAQILKKCTHLANHRLGKNISIKLQSKANEGYVGLKIY